MVLEGSKEITIRYDGISTYNDIMNNASENDVVKKHIKNIMNNVAMIEIDYIDDILILNDYTAFEEDDNHPYTFPYVASIKLSEILIEFRNLRVAKKYYMILVDFKNKKDVPKILSFEYIKSKYPESLI